MRNIIEGIMEEETPDKKTSDSKTTRRQSNKEE